MTLQSLHNNTFSLTKESTYVILGVLLGTCLGWSLNSILLERVEWIEPVTLQFLFLILGGTIVLGMIGARYFRFVKSYRLLILLLCTIAILIYVTALEIFWHDPLKSYFLIGGLVPSSDADSWLTGGWRLLESSTLSPFDERRPINAALHAVRLFVTGDLQLSILLTTLIAGAASVFAAVSIRESLGWVAATVFFFVSFTMIEEHLPLTMTEIHGYIFGSLAIGLIWRTVIDRSLLTFAFGLALLSISLNARSGPFIVLLTILLWGVLNLTYHDKRSYVVFIVGSLGIALGFIVSKLFLVLWGTGGHIQQANFALTFYGMVVGGKGWEQALVDHPDVIGQTFGGNQETHIAIELYKIALRELVSSPTTFVSYYINQLIYFVHLFMKYDLGLSRLITIIAAIWVLFRWREPLAQLCILMFFGILLSAPFLMEDAGVRPFAPVFPVLAAIPALVCGLVTKFVSWVCQTEAMNNSTREQKPWGMVLVGLITVITTVVGPIIAVASYEPLTQKQWKCGDDEDSIRIDPSTTALVNVLEDSKGKRLRVPNISYSQFLNTFPGSQGGSDREELMAMSPPFSFVSTMNISEGGREYVLINELIINQDKAGITLCVSRNLSQGYRMGHILRK